MTFKKIAVEASLWITFFSFTALACALALDYAFLDAYMSLRASEWVLFLSLMINFVTACRLLYLHGIKSWRTFPIIIGLIMAWWRLFEGGAAILLWSISGFV